MLNSIVWNRTDIYMKRDLALNNLQKLICHKTQPTNQLTNQSALFYVVFVSMHRCYIQCWQVIFHFLFLTHCLCLLWSVKPFYIVISFLVLLSLRWSSSLIHFKNGPVSLTRGTAQMFINSSYFCYIVWFRVVLSLSWSILFYFCFFFFHLRMFDGVHFQYFQVLVSFLFSEISDSFLILVVLFLPFPTFLLLFPCLRVFHTNFNWWISSGAWVKTSLLRPPHPSIFADFESAVIWIISVIHLNSSPSSLFYRFLEIFPTAPDYYYYHCCWWCRSFYFRLTQCFICLFKLIWMLQLLIVQFLLAWTTMTSVLPLLLLFTLLFLFFLFPSYFISSIFPSLPFPVFSQLTSLTLTVTLILFVQQRIHFGKYSNHQEESVQRLLFRGDRQLLVKICQFSNYIFNIFPDKDRSLLQVKVINPTCFIYISFFLPPTFIRVNAFFFILIFLCGKKVVFQTTRLPCPFVLRYSPNGLKVCIPPSSTQLSKLRTNDPVSWKRCIDKSWQVCLVFDLITPSAISCLQGLNISQTSVRRRVQPINIVLQTARLNWWCLMSAFYFIHIGFETSEKGLKRTVCCHYKKK